jgi:hypothetical protein
MAGVRISLLEDLQTVAFFGVLNGTSCPPWLKRYAYEPEIGISEDTIRGRLL